MNHDYYTEDIDEKEYQKFIEYLHQIRYEGLIDAVEEFYVYTEDFDKKYEDVSNSI